MADPDQHMNSTNHDWGSISREDRESMALVYGRSETQSGAQVKKPYPLRIFFVDPIGHILGAHDYEICLNLSRRGHHVFLVTSDRYVYRNHDAGFSQLTGFRGTSGELGPLLKGFNYLLGLSRVLVWAICLRPMVVILYYSVLPFLDRCLLNTLSILGIKTLLCVHDALPLGNGCKQTMNLNRLYQTSPEILTFSRFTKEVMTSKLGIASHKIHSLFLGVNQVDPVGPSPAKEKSRAALGLPSEGPILLCFGQIKKNKDLNLLLQAFSGVLRTFPEIFLYIVGRPRGIEEQSIIKKINTLGLCHRVFFDFSMIPESKVFDCFSATDLVVLPYKEIYQSAVLGLAASFGKTIIATKVGSIPEFLEDGETAYLCAPGDATSLEKAILAALTNPDEATKRGEKAKRMMVERYSWQRFSEEIEKLLYDQVTIEVAT